MRIRATITATIAVLTLAGCATTSPPTSTPVAADSTTEQVACRQWAAAFRLDHGIVNAATAASTVAPRTPSGQAMAVFIAASGVPGVVDEQTRVGYLLAVRDRCAEAGARFDYPAA